MEEVYQVRVRYKPDPSAAYPSERLYSSSTVGGLAITHFLLAALSTILISIAYCQHGWRGEYTGGILQIIGAMLCTLAGILAWKRWYIDRFIRWFFITNIISVITSLICFIITIIILVIPSFSKILKPHNGNVTIELNNLNIIQINDHSDYKLDIYIHIILTAIAEIFWSIFSMKIAWNGVKNIYKKQSIDLNFCRNKEKHVTCPDIIENHVVSSNSTDPALTNYSNVVKELCRLHKNHLVSFSSDNSDVEKKIASAIYMANYEGGEGLPLPESRLEYRERMENFIQQSAYSNKNEKDVNFNL